MRQSASGQRRTLKATCFGAPRTRKRPKKTGKVNEVKVKRTEEGETGGSEMSWDLFSRFPPFSPFCFARISKPWGVIVAFSGM